MLLPPPTPTMTSGLKSRAAAAALSMVAKSTSGRPPGKMSTSAPPALSKVSTLSAMPLLTMLASVQTMTRLPSSSLTFRSSSRTPHPNRTRPAVEYPQWRLPACCAELLCGMPYLLGMWNPVFETLLSQFVAAVAGNHYPLESLLRPRCTQLFQILLYASCKCFTTGEGFRIHDDEQVTLIAAPFRVECSEHGLPDVRSG